MTDFFFLLTNLSSLVCIIAAAYLAMNDIMGWGWFLFVALLMTHYLNIKDTPTEDTGDEDES